MTTKGEQERERLKQEYKEHYRKIRDAKEKLRRSQYVKNVSHAMKQMNADQLLESVDEFLGKLRHNMASIEARLDVAMEQVMDESEHDEELKKEKAKETIRQVKRDLGLLYNDLEKQAAEMDVKKTVGAERNEQKDSKSRE